MAILINLVVAAGCSATLGDATEETDGASGDAAPSSFGAEAPEVGKEFSCNPEASRPGPNLVRRLTQAEYAATVSDTLGVDVSAEAADLPDLPSTERSFDNKAVELTVTPSHIQAYGQLAHTIVSRIPNATAWATGLAGCSEFTAACESAFVESAALLLFRAPVRDVETTALRKVFAAGRSQDLSFADSALHVLEAMLQSPRFIYRVENETGDGSVRPLEGYELASRLSYAVWGSAPDQELLAAAEAGELSTAEQVTAQVDRMLEDPRAREAAVRFLSDWFDLHRMEHFSPDEEHFPDFDPALADDMSAETRATFVHVITEELPLSTLFDLQQTTVSRELAEYYGLPSPQDGVTTYDLTDVPERGGVLTQGALHSIGGAESSTVRRGLFFLYQVLCGAMDEPPAGADTTPIPADATSSIRDISEVRVDKPSCGGCHSQFEPLVWGLVPFDAAGAFNTHDQFGNPLPQDGFIVFPGEAQKVEYDTVAEMMSALAKSSRVRDCSTIKSFEYLMGRPLITADGCSLATAQERLVQSGGSYRDLLLALVLSDNFKNIQTEAL